MKKRMLSIIYGVLLACGISLAQTTMAACQGYCADRLPGADGLGDYEFDGCELTLDKNDRVIGVTCFYSRIVIE